MARKITQEIIEKYKRIVYGQFEEACIFKAESKDEFIEVIYFKKCILPGTESDNRIRYELEMLYKKILEGEIQTYSIFDKDAEFPEEKDLERILQLRKLTG